MIQFKAVSNQFRDLFSEYVSAQALRPMVKNASASSQSYSMSAGSPALEAQPQGSQNLQLVQHNQCQGLLRPLLGKGEPQSPSIGDHPDFDYLRGTEEEAFCAVTTLFMDMEGSTRLNLLHSPSDVARIKNAFIQLAIEVIKAFDGHVHRIMGDAVMAYFGGPDSRQESTAIDAVNCASVLQLLVQKSVIPFLKRESYGDGFGIRIGVDYGPEDRVIWRSYGFPGIEEVTATSFYVDVASKLQHAAGRHEIMIGSSLQEFLDFPEELLKTKSVVRNGEVEQRPYLLPNLADMDGKPINYKQHVLKWDKYLECSPVAGKLLESEHSESLQVTATLHAEIEGDYERPFISGSTVGQKGKAVCFKIRKLPYTPQLPYVVKCIVENHGNEAKQASDDSGDHETEYKIASQADHKDILHWEELSYRGLHYLIVEIRKGCGTLIARKKFGVYVE